MLTDEELRRLLARGEQFTAEFLPETDGPLADDQLVDAVVCLANGHGGVVLVGVDDDGRATGAHHRHGSYTDPHRVALMISGRTVPSCPVECSMMPIDGVEVLVIEIPAGRPVTSTSDGVYRRRGTDAHGRPVCVPFLVHEIQGREATRGALDYTALVVPEARWEDLDPLEIERVRRTIAMNRGRADSALLDLSDAEIVRALGLGEGGKERGDRVERVRVAALLIVGREEAIKRYVPNHEVAFHARIQPITGRGRFGSTLAYDSKLFQSKLDVMIAFAHCIGMTRLKRFQYPGNCPLFHPDPHHKTVQILTGIIQPMKCQFADQYRHLSLLLCRH